MQSILVRRSNGTINCTKTTGVINNQVGKYGSIEDTPLYIKALTLTLPNGKCAAKELVDVLVLAKKFRSRNSKRKSGWKSKSEFCREYTRLNYHATKKQLTELVMGIEHA